MKIFAAFILFASVLFSGTAKASFWISCNVHAKVAPANSDGLYPITVLSAKISDGHDKKGNPCMQNNIGKTLLVKIDGDVPSGNNVRLKYDFYNDMTEKGVVNTETWSYSPASNLIPWR